LRDMSLFHLMKCEPTKLIELVDRHMPILDRLGDHSDSVVILGNCTWAAMLMCRNRRGLTMAERSFAMAERLNDDRRVVSRTWWKFEGGVIS